MEGLILNYAKLDLRHEGVKYVTAAWAIREAAASLSRVNSPLALRAGMLPAPRVVPVGGPPDVDLFPFLGPPPPGRGHRHDVGGGVSHRSHGRGVRFLTPRHWGPAPPTRDPAAHAIRE